MKKRQYDVSGL